MTQLAIGETRSFPVDPRPLFVPTGLEVIPGERYRFTGAGKWKDGPCTVDANGWKLWPLQHWNRVPGTAFFCLCGCVGTDDRQAFAIGATREWTVPESIAELANRQLHFFANDWACMYGNNQALPPEKGGPLTVSITRLA